MLWLNDCSLKLTLMHQAKTLIAAHPLQKRGLKSVSKKPTNLSWWSPVYRGLVADPQAKHYQRLRASIYLYLFLILHADRSTGRLYRKLPTIALEMGINLHTIRKWLKTLRQHGYVTTTSTGRATHIAIKKWKTFRPAIKASSSPE